MTKLSDLGAYVEIPALSKKRWAPFSIVGLFSSIVPGKGKGLNHLKQTRHGGVNYIGATNRNNGVLCYVEEDRRSRSMVLEGNCIGFIKNGDGSAGYAIYKAERFVSTSDVLYGYADWLNKYTGLFFVTAQDMIERKYSHGYKRNKEHLAGDKVMLPVDDSGKPDYGYMEQYVKNLMLRKYSAYLDYIESKVAALERERERVNAPLPKLFEKEWREFSFSQIFDIKKGFYNKKPACEEKGSTPFLGATDSNNGTTRFLTRSAIEESSKTGDGRNDPIDKKLFPGHAIAVTNNGSVGHAYYQASEFTCSHDVNPLYLIDHEMSCAEAMFFIKAIEQQGRFFQYARKWRPCRMVNSKLLLPATSSGSSDYAYMERYGRGMLLRKYRKYLGILRPGLESQLQAATSTERERKSWAKDDI